MNFQMDQRCLKCPAVLVCLTSIFDITLLKCDKCKRKMLSVIRHDRVSYAEEIIFVTCDRYECMKGNLCEKCSRKVSNTRLP